MSQSQDMVEPVAYIEGSSNTATRRFSIDHQGAITKKIRLYRTV
jgi:hypothetical protein